MNGGKWEGMLKVGRLRREEWQKGGTWRVRYILGKEGGFDNREEWKEGYIIGKAGRNGGKVHNGQWKGGIEERVKERWEGKIYHRQGSREREWREGYKY